MKPAGAETTLELPLLHQAGSAADLPEALFMRWALERGFLMFAYRHFPAAESAVKLEEKLRAEWASDHGSTWSLRDAEKGLLLLNRTGGFVNAYAAAATTETAQSILDDVQARIGREGMPRHLVPITFWAYNPQHPIEVLRDVEAQSWEDVADNYAASTRQDLARLLDWRPGGGGQLLLWSGKPGTGKTTAIRSFAREWRDWADFHYVVDPDKFFGSEADYMLHVLLHGSDERWRILLLEDAGELLVADARERTGQGLSRFLNAVDGLIGQGLRIVVLVTTNEDVKKLNPAVARPGRCAANIEFALLNGGEAAEWLEAHGAEPDDTEPRTLADLYAILAGVDTAPVRSIGFGSAA